MRTTEVNDRSGVITFPGAVCWVTCIYCLSGSHFTELCCLSMPGWSHLAQGVFPYLQYR